MLSMIPAMPAKDARSLDAHAGGVCTANYRISAFLRFLLENYENIEN